MLRKLALGTLSTVIALAVVVLAAPAASAHGKGKHKSPLVLVAEENQSEFVDVGTPGPSLGDELVFSETLFRRHREAGVSGGVCTATEVTPPYDVTHVQLRRHAEPPPRADHPAGADRDPGRGRPRPVRARDHRRDREVRRRRRPGPLPQPGRRPRRLPAAVGQGQAAARAWPPLSPGTSSAATIRRSPGSTSRRTRSPPRPRPCCARPGSAATCACWISGRDSGHVAFMLAALLGPGGSVPRDRPGRAAARGRRAPPRGRGRDPRRVRARRRADVRLRTAVRRDRRAADALPPARPRGGAAAPPRRARARRDDAAGRVRHRRHARRAGGAARRLGAALDRGGVQVGRRGPADRRARRRAPPRRGLRGRDDVRDRALPRARAIRPGRSCAPGSRARSPRRSSPRGSRRRRSWDSTRCGSAWPRRPPRATRRCCRPPSSAPGGSGPRRRSARRRAVPRRSPRAARASAPGRPPGAR